MRAVKRVKTNSTKRTCHGSERRVVSTLATARAMESVHASHGPSRHQKRRWGGGADASACGAGPGAPAEAC